MLMSLMPPRVSVGRRFVHLFREHYTYTMCTMEMQLKDLRGIGKKMLEDFEELGIQSVNDLKSRDAQKLYDRMCKLTGTRQDPCVLDTYRCAIEQARNPDLPKEQRDWWYWSRLRKSGRVGMGRLTKSSKLNTLAG